MTRTRLFGLLVCAAHLLFPSCAVHAAVLYDMTWDGAQLYNDPTITFPTRTPVLAGTELQYGAGSVGFEKFMQIPLASAGSLPATGDIVVTVNFQVERGSSSFKPNFMFNDGGQRFLGMTASSTASENAGDGALASFYDLDGNNTGEGVDINTLFFNAAFPSIGGILEGTARYTLRPVIDDVAFLTFGGKQLHTVYVNLNRSGPLSFSYWPTSASETGSIHSLSIKVEQVPEPMTGMLVALSAVGGLAIRRRFVV
jgi:hypothetical protein